MDGTHIYVLLIDTLMAAWGLQKGTDYFFWASHIEALFIVEEKVVFKINSRNHV